MSSKIGKSVEFFAGVSVLESKSVWYNRNINKEKVMDYKKIGDFIKEKRKAQKLTQAKLAEKLFVSEKTISKWENGNGIPDTNTLPKLCEILKTSVNELLNGEAITSENYVQKAEQKLLDIQKLQENNSKTLLTLEIVLGVMSVVVLLTYVFLASFLELADWQRIIMICVGTVIALVGCGFALWIEQIAGYYHCSKCGHKYIPTFNQVLWAMHMGRTRYMKCPNCNQKSWQKKVVK